MSHPVNWFAIQGPDGRTLQKFYKAVFDWPMEGMPGGDMMMVPAQPPDGIPGGIGTSQNHQPSVAVYITVGDIDAYFGKVERAGGRMAMPKTELPNDMGSIAGFTDPAGNWIGMWEAPKSGAATTAVAPKKSAGAKKKASSTKKKAAAAPKKAAARKAKAKAGTAKRTAAAPKKKAVAKKKSRR